MTDPIGGELDAFDDAQQTPPAHLAEILTDGIRSLEQRVDELNDLVTEINARVQTLEAA